jgi:3-methyladenine DNA glycosylase Tag
MSQSSTKRQKYELVFKQNEVEKIIALNEMNREREIKRMIVRKERGLVGVRNAGNELVMLAPWKPARPNRDRPPP